MGLYFLTLWLDILVPSASRNGSKSRDFVQLEVNFEKSMSFLMFFLNQNFNTLLIESTYLLLDGGLKLHFVFLSLSNAILGPQFATSGRMCASNLGFWFYGFFLCFSRLKNLWS